MTKIMCKLVIYFFLYVHSEKILITYKAIVIIGFSYIIYLCFLCILNDLDVFIKHVNFRKVKK